MGHVPRTISTVCSLFLRRGGGSIECQINGNRRYSRDLPQGGLEIPCVLTFRGGSILTITKVQKLIRQVPSTSTEPTCTEIETVDVGTVEFNRAKRSKTVDLDDDHDQRPQEWLCMPNNMILNIFRKRHLSTVMQNQFPHIKGLSSTLSPSSVGFWLNNYVQIFHCRNNHWITVSIPTRKSIFMILCTHVLIVKLSVALRGSSLFQI